ncbi:MAG: MobC family plasmid mobilization relaxosome protein [Ruminococcus sp.]|nr:MobC family plasmid mobilization relaxosome protein [Ruminococcus sp.]
MAKRNISKTVKFLPEELAKVERNASELNLKPARYIRTMAVDGQILRLEVPEYHNTIKELHRIGSLINQITRRLNETGSFYYDDMQNIKEEHENICRMLNQYLSTLRLKKL